MQEPTLDHAVGIVLCTSFGIQCVLITRELTAVEAEPIGITNQTMYKGLTFRKMVKKKKIFRLTQQPERPFHTH